ncbi:unnamed protein product [Tuber aestivum]|uniref:Uncharacterized protein n=1 Tax=Tuber aestivum TaxID=59557 RepID=A0A292PRM6_9PEZI|nr:unnamed protein product [Tuber aestivum]
MIYCIVRTVQRGGSIICLFSPDYDILRVLYLHKYFHPYQSTKLRRIYNCHNKSANPHHHHHHHHHLIPPGFRISPPRPPAIFYSFPLPFCIGSPYQQHFHTAAATTTARTGAKQLSSFPNPPRGSNLAWRGIWVRVQAKEGGGGDGMIVSFTPPAGRVPNHQS